jgi:hypothetical protein
LLEIGDENANDDVDTNLYSREISVATDEWMDACMDGWMDHACNTINYMNLQVS